MLLVQQLHDFLVRTGQTREDFAVQMGVNPSLLSRLIPCDGGPPIREPRLTTMKRVVAAWGARSGLRISAGRALFCRSRTAKEDLASLANAANHPGRLIGLSAGKIESAGHDGARFRSS